MRKGTHSNQLTLVDNSGHRIRRQDDLDDYGVEYVSASGNDNLDLESYSSSTGKKQTLLIFMAVSLSCAVAAIASGSYAIWLSRSQASRETLSSVENILENCQARMHELENDLRRLPAT